MSNQRPRKTPATPALSQLVITRPGGEVVMLLHTAGEWPDFRERAAAWWATAPAQLSLLGGEETREDRRTREAVEFRDAIKTWALELDAVPKDVTLNFIDPEEVGEPAGQSSTPTVPRQARAAVSGDHYPALANVARRGISAFVIASSDERVDTDRGVMIRHVDRGRDLVAEVEMRQRQREVGAPINHSEIRSAAAALGGVDEDVLDVLLANAVNHGPASDGLYEIDVDAIVTARGRGAKTKREGGKSYAAGLQENARQDVREAIEALDRLFIAVGEPRKRRDGSLVDRFERVFKVEHIDIHRPTGDIVRLRYSFGRWFDAWRAGQILAPRKLLELDGHRNASAKRLGRYFVTLGDLADQRGFIRRQVAEIFSDLRRSLEGGQANPSRVRSRFEQDLNALAHDRIILSWNYDPYELSLPRYGWFPTWLQAMIVVELPASVIPKQ
jgi:hypothetical protein